MTTDVAIVLTGGTIGQRPGIDGAVPDGTGTVELLARAIPAGTTFRHVTAMSRNSPDIGPAQWEVLARTVRDLLADTDDPVSGVIVLHGTDTLAYSAAALSFALGRIEQPVVVTGSMIPGMDPGSDAARNIASAVAVARSGLAGVNVVFTSPDARVDADVISGVRAVKHRTGDTAAFVSVGARPIARVVGYDVISDQRAPLQVAPVPSGTDWAVPTVPTVPTVFATTVDVVKVSPFTSAARLSQMLSGLDGVVIEGFGAGHVREDHLEVLRAFGGAVVIASQVVTDIERLGTYASDRALIDVPNVIVSGPMTSTAALVKLSWIIGQGRPVRDTMRADLVGELLLAD